jgi:hypothetical protein
MARRELLSVTTSKEGLEHNGSRHSLLYAAIPQFLKEERHGGRLAFIGATQSQPTLLPRRATQTATSGVING